jgi:ribosome-associated translation inhibitor RaiA
MARALNSHSAESHRVRIHVIGDEAISPQARMYAEYRVFAALAESATENVRDSRVELRQGQRNGGERIDCHVTVHLDGGAVLRSRGTGTHAYAAINRAVQRLGAAASRRLARARLKPVAGC